jgi:hypothetical protein
MNSLELLRGAAKIALLLRSSEVRSRAMASGSSAVPNRVPKRRFKRAVSVSCPRRSRFLLTRWHLAGRSRFLLTRWHLAGRSRFLLTRWHLAGRSRFLLTTWHLAGRSRFLLTRRQGDGSSTGRYSRDVGWRAISAGTRGGEESSTTEAWSATEGYRRLIG